jgi:hypothetical protein
MTDELVICGKDDSATDAEVLFEPSLNAVSVVRVNEVDIIVPKREARKRCTINDILSSVGGECDPNEDFMAQSTFGDNSRLAKKMGVSVKTVREWRKQHPIIDQAMTEEQERDKDWVENIARGQMMAGDSKMTMFWLAAKARDRGFGKEMDRYRPPEVSNEALNKKIKELSPRERLKMLAESHKSGEYEGANAQYHGSMG